MIDADVEALFQDACSLHRLGKQIESQAACEAVFNAVPNHGDAFHLLGIIAAQSEDFLLAEALFAKAIFVDPIHPIYRSNRGLALQKLKRLHEAIDSFDIAISIHLNFAEAYYNPGIVLQELKRLEPAVADYDRAIALNANYVDAIWNKGLALLLLGEFKRRWEAYEWLWMLERDDSPWYPGMRLFRQQADGDWRLPLLEIEKAIVALRLSSSKSVRRYRILC